MDKFRTLKDAEATGLRIQCDDGRCIVWIPDPTYSRYVEILTEEELELITALEAVVKQRTDYANATVVRMATIAQNCIDKFMKQY